MKPGFMDYLRGAFNARPFGMVVPPNWVGLAAFTMLGTLNWGLWVLGAGVELLYLFSLVTHGRFRRTVDAAKLASAYQARQTQIEQLVAQLDAGARERYRTLQRRCQAILEQQRDSGTSAGLAAQGEGLGRLLWIYLRLLLTRHAMTKVLTDPGAPTGPGVDGIDGRILRLQRQLAGDRVDADLRKSLAGQIEILQQRRERQGEARQRLAFLDAELTRLQEQVELIREGAALSSDPEALSHRIDEVAATLGGTSQWIQEQQRLLGEVDDLLANPPPVMMQPAARESA